MCLITCLHHASLMIRDLERSLAFYCQVLGLELDEGRPDLGHPGAWLKIGDQQIHLLQLPNPDLDLERPSHAGHDRHLALTVSDIDRLQSLLDGIGLAYTRSNSGRCALFCRDPDSNGLEFIEQRNP